MTGQNSNKTLSIFYSHASREKPLVRELHQAVGKRFDAWIDEEELSIGDNLDLSLADAIDQVDIFVILICEDAAQSGWVKEELGRARKREETLGYNFIFPVVIDENALEAPDFQFLAERKFLRLNSFESADIRALAEKLNGEIVNWLLKRYSEMNRTQSSELQNSRNQKTSEDFPNWLRNDALTDMIDELDKTIVNRSLSEVFVCPPLLKIMDSKVKKIDDYLDEGSSAFQFQDLIVKEQNFSIFVHPEFGQTSLAMRMARCSFEASKDISKPRLPIVIDAARWRNNKPYHSDFMRMLRRGAPESLPRKIKDLLEGGDVFLIIENIEIGNDELISFLNKFCSLYSSNKFAFLVRCPIVGLPPVRIALDVGVPHEAIYLAPFRREHVRTFICQWGVPSTWDKEQLVNTVIDRFSQLNVPICAVNLTIFMYVLCRTNDNAPVNLSVLLELFIDAILEKNDPKMIFRQEFDFRNKVDFLAYIAAYMTRENRYLVDENSFLVITKGYFDDIDVTQSASDVVKYFIDTQIFQSAAGFIGFRYSIFYSYFLAQAMAASQEFRCFIISEENVTRFLLEIDIYFGLVRNDLESLELLARFHRKATDELDACLTESGLNIPASLVETLQLPQSKNSEQIIESVAKQIAAGASNAADRDRNLSTPYESQIGHTQQFERPQFQDAVARWVMSLRCYSVALKNMELISGVKKRHHMALILQSWAKAIGFGVVVVDALAKDGRIRLGGIVFTSLTSKGKNVFADAEFVRLAYLAMPLTIADYMRRDLGTAKLGNLINNDALGDGSLLIEFLQKSLSTQLRLPSYLSQLKVLVERLRGRKYLSEVVLWMLRGLHLQRNLSKDEESEFTRVSAELSLDIRNLHGTDRNRANSRLIETYNKERLVSQLRKKLTDRF